MSDDNKIRIELTKEQQQQLKEASGQQVESLEFTVNELEQRIAPAEFLKFTMTNVFISG